MLRIGIGVAVGFASLSADAIQTFFEQLQQTFTLNDEARGILDNDVLA
jgi:hypothetical protein